MSTDYAALADTIKIEDITSKEQNREILHGLKNNDESFGRLYIIDGDSDDGDDYSPDDGEDLGWLGYYIGQNTKLQELNFYITIDNESFYKEMIRNRIIKEIQFYGINLLDGKVFRMLNPFLKNNHSLTQISVQDSEFREESARQLSLGIGGCSQLKNINISDNIIGIGQLVNIITALSMHPQLEQLDLTWMRIGINECTALSTLLRCTTTKLQKLNLHGNNIDDEGVEVLVNALADINTLQELKLGYNQSIAIEGWTAVSTLLERPGTVENLSIYGNNIGDEGALIFANALANNSTLKCLYLDGNGITAEGWKSFSKLLCNTSSIINTYNSNHTLTYLGDTEGSMKHTFIPAFLRLNEGTLDKGKVAMQKILQHHSHFDMHPFFEWELKVLPIVLEWLEKVAAHCTSAFEIRKINKMRLATTFDFIKEFPMRYIEPVTRKEIADYTAMEEEHLLRTGGGDKRLAEIRQHKARAMRRLQ